MAPSKFQIDKRSRQGFVFGASWLMIKMFKWQRESHAEQVLQLASPPKYLSNAISPSSPSLTVNPPSMLITK